MLLSATEVWTKVFIQSIEKYNKNNNNNNNNNALRRRHLYFLRPVKYSILFYHYCSHSRFRFAEESTNPAPLLGCCASRQASSAAIGWRGDTTNQRSFLIDQSGQGWRDRPHQHWTTSNQPGDGAPSNDSHQSSPGHLGDRSKWKQKYIKNGKNRKCRLNQSKAGVS